MVSSVVGIPAWLKPMLGAGYFNPCGDHENSNKSECNFFCLDCISNALCSYCSIHHKNHRLLQIRRSSYHNVVRVNEIQRYIDISCIQTYVINSAKIVFLNERPQPRAGKGVTYNCEICHRGLPDSFRFCSLGCKLNGMMRGGDKELSFSLRVKHGREMFDESSSECSDYETSMPPRKIQVLFSSPSSSLGLSPPTPPLYNHTNSSRRKGVPHRAPPF